MANSIEQEKKKIRKKSANENSETHVLFHDQIQPETRLISTHETTFFRFYTKTLQSFTSVNSVDCKRKYLNTK